MADLLYQNEIDNLLSEMTSGRIHVEDVISGKFKTSDIAITIFVDQTEFPKINYALCKRFTKILRRYLVII